MPFTLFSFLLVAKGQFSSRERIPYKLILIDGLRTIFFLALGLSPIVVATLSYSPVNYSSMDTWNFDSYVPNFNLFLGFLLIISFLYFVIKCNFKGGLFQRERNYVYIILFGLLFFFAFSLAVGSSLINPLYYPEKLLWNCFLLMTPISGLLVGNVIILCGKLLGQTLIAIVVLLTSLFSIPYVAKHGIAEVAQINPTSTQQFPRSGYELLLSHEVLNSSEPTIVWNDDGYDWLVAYWLILSGQKTIQPLDANNRDISVVCSFLVDNPNARVISYSNRVLNSIEANCPSSIDNMMLFSIKNSKAVFQKTKY